MLNTTAPLIDEWGLQVLPEFVLESLESRARFRRLFVGLSALRDRKIGSIAWNKKRF